MGNKISSDVLSEITEKIQRNKSVAHNTYLPKERGGDRGDRYDKYDKQSKKTDGNTQEYMDRENIYYNDVRYLLYFLIFYLDSKQ